MAEFLDLWKALESFEIKSHNQPIFLVGSQLPIF